MHLQRHSTISLSLLRHEKLEELKNERLLFLLWTACYDNVFHHGGDRWHLILFTAVTAQGTITVIEPAINKGGAQAHLHGWAEWWNPVTWYEEVGQVKEVHEHFVTITKSLNGFDKNKQQYTHKKRETGVVKIYYFPLSLCSMKQVLKRGRWENIPIFPFPFRVWKVGYSWSGNCLFHF